MKRHIFLAILLLCAVLTGCASPSPTQAQTPTPTVEAAIEPTQRAEEEPSPGPAQESADFASRPLMRVASLKGPTGMGMVYLMKQFDERQTLNRYEFTLASTPDEIVAMFTSESVDAAAIPTNLAATLYQVTGYAEGNQGKVRLAAINTLGVLYILERGNSVQSAADLAGKTIYATGQGAMPEYVLDSILHWNGIEDAIVEFYTEHAELMTLMAAGKVDLAMLPEPFVTNLMAQADDVRIALDITKEYEAKSDSKLAMGAIAVRTAFSEENKEVFDNFLTEYKASVEYVNTDNAGAAALIEQYGVLSPAATAQKALPNCNIVYMDGMEMKSAAMQLLEQLYERNPKSIGGGYPDEYFYYMP